MSTETNKLIDQETLEELRQSLFLIHAMVKALYDNERPPDDYTDVSIELPIAIRNETEKAIDTIREFI